jgi:thiamine transport system permease protein
MIFILPLLFLLPILVLALHVKSISHPLTLELAIVLGQTTAQALISAVGSVALGFLGGVGLLSIANLRIRQAVTFFVLMPGLLPSLFVIVSVLNFVMSFAKFPFGIWGVAIVHIVSNVGLVSVGVSRLFEQKMGGLVEIATIEGASKLQILKVTAGALKHHLLAMCFLVFAVAFTSFSIPMVVGGYQGETLEVLIYRAAIGQGELGYAVGLSFVQIIFVSALSLLVRKSTIDEGVTDKHLSVLKYWPPLICLLGLTGIILFSSFVGFTTGLREIIASIDLQSALVLRAFSTFIQCLLTSFFILILFLMAAYSSGSQWLRSFFIGYAAPSSVILGLAVYLYFDSTQAHVLISIAVMSFAFALTVFPALFRLRGLSALSRLDRQIEVAQVMGASRRDIYFSIVLPNVKTDFLFLAGLSAFWASGDFALANMISGRELTLAQMAQNLMGGYRLEVATVVTWYSILVGVFVFFLYEVLSRVGDSKSYS